MWYLYVDVSGNMAWLSQDPQSGPHSGQCYGDDYESAVAACWALMQEGYSVAPCDLDPRGEQVIHLEPASF